MSLELGDQTIKLLYADTNGEKSSPFPEGEERDRLTFVYGGVGAQGDGGETFTVALYCIVSTDRWRFPVFFSFLVGLRNVFGVGVAFARSPLQKEKGNPPPSLLYLPYLSPKPHCNKRNDIN